MSELMSASLSLQNKRLVFRLEHDAWVAFVSDKTKGELYLPLSPAWRAKIFQQGWIMKNELRSFEVWVVDKRTKAEVKRRPITTTVRWTAIRPFERADKHIVLITK